MKGLLKFLSPFAPDQSGAVSVLYGLGGITVICDAGGCTGNVCGFDEPRWFHKSTALFSAGLRDMDAILGRDDKLVAKLKDAAEHLDAPFAALIGTPVPAVIATDFKALSRMATKRCRIPVIAVECTGTRLYDVGASDTYLACCRDGSLACCRDGSFVNRSVLLTSDKDGTVGDVVVEKSLVGGKPDFESTSVISDEAAGACYLGVLGVTPLDTSMLESEKMLKAKFEAEGYDKVLCYGADGLENLRLAPVAKKNLVIAPSGLKTAKYLEKTYGTPYEVAYPILKKELLEKLKGLGGKKILVVDQQVKANEIRKEVLAQASAVEDAKAKEMTCAGEIAEAKEAAKAAQAETQVTVGTWFMLDQELKMDGDVHFETENEFADFVYAGGFDVIIADKMMKRVVRKYDGEWIHLPHFAVSGEYEDED